MKRMLTQILTTVKNLSVTTMGFIINVLYSSIFNAQECLSVAVYWNSPFWINHSISSGANVNAHGNEGLTSLHMAAFEGYIESVTALLSAGANANVTDNSGNTPLHIAAFANQGTIVNGLLNAGANVHAVDNSGRTALHIAAFNNHASTIIPLVEAGANIHAADNFGQTPVSGRKPEA
jgi:ankyrin repeat protein